MAVFWLFLTRERACAAFRQSYWPGAADPDEASTPRCQVEAGHSGLASRAIPLAVRDPRLALGYLELGAKLNGELGRRAAEGPQVSVIVVGPAAEAIAALRAAAARISQEEDAEPL